MKSLNEDFIPDKVVEELMPKFFKGLSDATRVKIIEYLLKKERNVSELIDLIGVSQSSVSNHLACLKWCGYVTSRKDGKNIYYQVSDPRIIKIIELAQKIITDNAEHIYACTRMT